jgi:hypothetical protein
MDGSYRIKANYYIYVCMYSIKLTVEPRKGEDDKPDD